MHVSLEFPGSSLQARSAANEEGGFTERDVPSSCKLTWLWQACGSSMNRCNFNMHTETACMCVKLQIHACTQWPLPCEAQATQSMEVHAMLSPRHNLAC